MVNILAVVVDCVTTAPCFNSLTKHMNRNWGYGPLTFLFVHQKLESLGTIVPDISGGSDSKYLQLPKSNVVLINIFLRQGMLIYTAHLEQQGNSWCLG